MLKPEISFSIVYFADILASLVTHPLVRDIRKQTFYHTLSFCSCFRRSIIVQILLQCYQSIRQATIRYLSVFQKCHKAVTRASFTIARRTETRNVVKIEQPPYHLVERAMVCNVKLRRIITFRFRLHISAHTCTRKECQPTSKRREPPEYQYSRRNKGR